MFSVLFMSEYGMTKIISRLTVAVAGLALAACSASDDGNEVSSHTDGPQIDLIMTGEAIVTMDAVGTIIQDGAVAIDDGSQRDGQVEVSGSGAQGRPGTAKE